MRSTLIFGVYIDLFILASHFTSNQLLMAVPLCIDKVKTVSWVKTQSAAERERLVRVARGSVARMRKEGRERLVMIREKTLEGAREKRKVENRRMGKKVAKKQKLVDDLFMSGGPWQSQEEMDGALEELGEDEKKVALVAQLGYWKTVLEFPAPVPKFYCVSAGGKALPVSVLRTRMCTLLTDHVEVVTRDSNRA